jgi:hypothetical protein
MNEPTTQAAAAPPAHTPGEWRILEVMGKQFVAAPTPEGHPYHGRTRFIDIAGDEDYPTRDADLELIASAPKLAALNAELLEALKYCAAEIKAFYDAASDGRIKAEISIGQFRRLGTVEELIAAHAERT